MKQKRIATIQDISCFGKCSLTVALPVISAAGIEAAIIPTAVLSTHTGGFSGFTFRDLTGEIAPITQHWKKLGLNFDAVYTGYLGSFEQIELVKEFINTFKKPETLVIVDPAMADNGKLYGGFSEDFPKGMAKLCGQADVILPNLTEAAFMLGEEYVGSGYDKAYIEGLMKRLSALGAKKVVLTGVSFEEGKLGCASYDSASGAVGYYFNKRISGHFHGTGDIFASSFASALVKGFPVDKSMKIAADFTVESILKTREPKDTDFVYGVNFEEAFPRLMKDLEII